MSSDARLLQDSVAAMLSQPEHASEASLLGAFRDAGLDLALVTEADGGHGLPLVDAAVIAGEWGAHAAALPIVELLLAPRLASAAGLGDIRSTCTITQARGPSSEAPVFEGCTHVLSIQGETLSAVPIDLTKASGKDITGQAWVAIEADDFVAAGDNSVLVSLARDAALLTAAQMVGSMQSSLGLVIEHVNTRKQFGKSIGRFQAVQHLIADAATETKVAAAVVNSALALADADRIQPIDWLAAKSQAGRAAGIVAANAHQVMGAIGFTEEHVLHRFTKRLWCGRDNWGSDAACEREIGRLARAAGPKGLWQMLADGR